MSKIKRGVPMFKNKIALRLAGYFGVCLLVFSLVIGGVFMALFRHHTVELHRADLEQRAAGIAETLSGFMSSGNLQSGHESGGRGGYGAYLRFLGDLAMADVWIINQSLELTTCGQGEHNEALSYKDLPPDGDEVIDEVFSGKTAFSESFSTILNQPTITVGTPIKNGSVVIGVVLLHSPVGGTDTAISQGLRMLGISMAVALLLSAILALWLSKNFTDPIISKEAVEALRLEALRRDFVANISHELKTPVAVLRGSLEALIDGVVTDTLQVESYHREMLSETMYLQRLVGDLLDLSRLQNVDFVMEMSEVCPSELVDDAIRSVEHLAKAKFVPISLKKVNPPLSISGDYGRLRQMLLIVLDNAVKFSPEGATVDVLLSGNSLTIRDHGEGISPDELPFLFDRFYKSRSEQNKTGTGLGLAIAKQIAQRHGITIKAINADGGGAEFRFFSS